MSEKIYTGADDADLCPVVIPTPRAHAPNVLGWLKGAAQDAPPAVRYYLVAAKWDDDLRDRAQTVGEFAGADCFALFTGRGIDGCDVWARCKVEEIVEPQTVAEMIG